MKENVRRQGEARRRDREAHGDELWVARPNANKGLAHVSNAKLLRLHETFTEVKEKFGTREKLIDAIPEIEKRAKDEGYKTRLGLAGPAPLGHVPVDGEAPRREKAAAAAKAAKKAACGPKAKKPRPRRRRREEVRRPSRFHADEDAPR